MTMNTRILKIQFSKLVTVYALLVTLPLFAQTPAQSPMLGKSGAGVPPNVMLTMDDSGSMQFQTMPETVFASDTYATTNPVGSYQVRWDPNDNSTLTFLIGTVPGILNSQNYVLKALRSADTNTIFYNPEILYLPWLTSDGVTRLPNSPVAAAYLNPLIRTGAAGTVVNLTVTTAVAAFNAPAVIGSNNMVAGRMYAIVTTGNTNFTLRGAPNNDVGIIFTSTGSIAGTGTVIQTNGWCFTQNGNTANRANNAAGGCSATTPAFTHDPGVYFRLTKNGSGVYNAVNNQSNYTAFTINAAAGTTFTKYPKRTDCNTLANACSLAQERQNFANWFSYYRNRNMLARGAMMEAFGPVGNTFRLGFGRLNKGAASVDGVSTKVLESNTATYGGGGVRAYDTARKGQLFNWLLDLPANGGTPLVGAAIANGEYFSRTDTQSPWTNNPAVNTNVVSSNASCRRSYQILVTDGYWNDTVAIGNVDASTTLPTITAPGRSFTYVPGPPYSDGASNTVADAAMYYWARDLQPKVGAGAEAANTQNTVRPIGDNISFWQNLTTFTVAMGVRGTLKYPDDLPALSKTTGGLSWPAASPGNTTGANVDDLWHAAVNGRGKYFSVKDPQELATAISSTLAAASGGESSTAGVATASTTLESDNRKYKPKADTAIWSGDISAEPLDANGQSTASVWTAAQRLKNKLWSTRNIVTWDSGINPPAAVTFAWGSLSTANQSALGSVAATYTSRFTDYLRGSHVDEGVGNPFRTRIDSSGDPFVLGDFINANPVFIGTGFNGLYGNLGLGGATGYSSFLAAKAARTGVLFAGSNDGMLHGFKDSKGATAASALTDGTEVFAYVPRAVYSNLEKLLDKNYGTNSVPHKYFVDGPLKEADAFVKAPGASTASWRNYLLGSLGAGGRAVFALDVTDTANLNASTVRWEISSDLDSDLGYVMGAIKVGVLPNGRWVAIFGNGFSSTNGYATLFVVDIEDAASSNSSTRSAAIKKLNVDTGGGNGLGGVTLIHDLSGQISNVYVGDLKGNMWKLNYDGSASSKFVIDGSNALAKATDSSGTAQPITASPVVYNHSLGGKVVVFGTGKLFLASDEANIAQQSVYGIWDKPADSMTHPLVRSNLSERTLSSFLGTGASSATTFLSLSGSAVNWSTQRGWVFNLSDGTSVEKTNSVLPGGRVIYPVQVAGYSTAYVSAVAPVQGTPGVCDALSGSAANLLIPVENGLNPSNRNFSTNGDSIVNSSDAFSVGQRAVADGVDSIVRSRTTSGTDAIRDVGGGGGEGDCTGATCGASGNECVQSPLCTEEHTCLISTQNANGSIFQCVDSGAPPPPGGPVGNRQYDRVWRRIVVPPIH